MNILTYDSNTSLSSEPARLLVHVTVRVKREGEPLSRPLFCGTISQCGFKRRIHSLNLKVYNNVQRCSSDIGLDCWVNHCMTIIYLPYLFVKTNKKKKKQRDSELPMMIFMCLSSIPASLSAYCLSKQSNVSH